MSDNPVNINLEELKELIRLLKESNVAEFELRKPDYRLRIKQGTIIEVPGLDAVASPVNGSSPVVAPAQVSNIPVSRPAPPVDEGLVEIRSPMVGTFYRSSSPGSAAFVEPGDRVRKGQVLCIIEAMKIMNEIESDVEGEVRNVHAANGQPVEFGEPLFSIKPVE